MRIYQSLIFDLDGTLTESGPGVMNCADYALKSLGITVEPFERLRCVVGPPLGDSLRRFGVPEDRIEEGIRLFRKQYAETGKWQNRPYPGIHALLDRCRQAGFSLYVGTSKPEPLAMQIMEKYELSSYFDRICGSAWDHSRETKEDVLLYLMREVGAERPVMIGDTIYDVEGAVRAGMPAIGVAWGYGVPEDMRRAGAEAIARDMDELYQLVSREE